MRCRRLIPVIAAFVGVAPVAGCRRTEPNPAPAATTVAAAPACDAAGHMNLTALAALPELSRLISTWLQQSSPELATALNDGKINPLEGMERAQIRQTARRSATGGRELAVTMTGNGAPALFARLSGAPASGKTVKRQQLAGADVLSTDCTWVALRNQRLVMATTEEVLGRALSDPGAADAGGDAALLSLTFTGQVLQDILAGGRAFRVTALNAIQALRVDFAADGTGLTSWLKTADHAAAEGLAAPLQKFLEALKESSKQDAGPHPELEARVIGSDVIVTAHFGRQVLDRFAQALALRAPKPSATRLR